MSLFKAQATLRELKQRTQLQLPQAVLSDASDVAGVPDVLKVVNAGETILIRINVLPNPAAKIDGLGLTQEIYSPHLCQILRIDGAHAVDASTREKMTAFCSHLGMKLQIWENTTLPASFDTTGATLVAEIKADPINPLVISQ